MQPTDFMGWEIEQITAADPASKWNGKACKFQGEPAKINAVKDGAEVTLLQGSKMRAWFSWKEVEKVMSKDKNFKG